MSLIDSRKHLNRKKVKDGTFDSHHIIPKCMGGSNAESNKVLLTPREHFIAHLLLSKSVEQQYRKQMYCALVRFMGKNSDRSRIKINSKTYETIIYNNRVYSLGENNSFYGKHHTEETKKILSKKSKEYCSTHKNPFYGKSHTEETKNILSYKRSKPIRVYFTNGVIVHFSQYKYLGFYLGKSGHLGCKLVKPQFIHLLKNYNILRIEKV
jgi:hypothetical protein